MSGNDTENAVPLTIGIISDPPTLILIYEYRKNKSCNSSDPENSITVKRRKRTMPLHNFSDKTDVRKFIFTLHQRHGKFLSSVPQVYLEKMLRIIQVVQTGSTIAEAVKFVDAEFEVSGDEDLNKISADELKWKKDLMSETFKKHLLLPGDPDYVYDKEVEFVPEVGIRSAWDEDEDDNSIRQEPVQTDLFQVKETNHVLEKPIIEGVGPFELFGESQIPESVKEVEASPKSTFAIEPSITQVSDPEVVKPLPKPEEILEVVIPKAPSEPSEVASIRSNEFEAEAEEEEFPFSTRDLPNEQEFKLCLSDHQDDENEVEDDDEFWKF